MFGDHVRHGHWEFWVKCVFKYWDLILRNREGLEGVGDWVIHKEGEKQGVCPGSA